MCDVAAACCSLVAVSSHAVARSYKLPVHVLTQIGKAARAAVVACLRGRGDMGCICSCYTERGQGASSRSNDLIMFLGADCEVYDCSIVERRLI
jgi:hypothetical protein